MNTTIRVFLFTCVMSVIAISAWQGAGLGMGVRPPVVGNPAPDFQLTDLQGKAHTLRQFRGKVVLLNFWATWCKPCVKEMPAMQAAYDKFRDQGFVVLAINELEDRERVEKHVKEHKHTFDVLMDEDNQVANMYGVVGLPVSVFIDQTGRVQEYVRGGLLTEDLIEKTVNRIVSEVTLSEKRTEQS